MSIGKRKMREIGNREDGETRRHRGEGMGKLEDTGMRWWGDKEIGRKKPIQKFKQ